MIILRNKSKILILFTLIFSISCINTNKTNNKKNEGDKINSIAKPDNTYPLFISFYSTGEGINIDALNKFETHLNTFLKKNALNSIGEEKIQWGREGEIDYCISFLNINQSIIEDFINQTKTLLSNLQHVTIKEKSICVHKR